MSSNEPRSSRFQQFGNWYYPLRMSCVQQSKITEKPRHQFEPSTPNLGSPWHILTGIVHRFHHGKRELDEYLFVDSQTSKRGDKAVDCWNWWMWHWLLNPTSIVEGPTAKQDRSVARAWCSCFDGKREGLVLPTTPKVKSLARESN